MKKLITIALSMLLIASAMTVGAFADRGLTYTAPKGTPVIDGTAEEIWDNAEWTLVDLPYSSDSDTYGHQLRVKILWDEEAFYVYGEVTCPTMNDHNDYMEVYIEEDNARDGYSGGDMQVGFNQYGCVSGYGQNNRSEDCEGVSVITDTGYVCEAKIKWSGLNTVAEGSSFGLEFMLLAQDWTEVMQQALRWNVDTNGGDNPPYLSTEKFGTLVLGAAPASAETEMPATEAPETEAPSASQDNTKATQTSDGIALSVSAAVAALGCAAIVFKKKG